MTEKVQEGEQAPGQEEKTKEVVISDWNVPIVNGQLQPKNLEQLFNLAKIFANSGMVPKQYVGKPNDVIACWSMGSELGLSHMTALANIAVINGQPSLWGGAVKALVEQSGLLEHFKEWWDGAGDAMIAYCEVQRKGREKIIREYSMADAKQAGLLGKDNWKHNPKRMTQMRARQWALNDEFPDVLKGLIIRETAGDDYIDVTPTEQSSGLGPVLDAALQDEEKEPEQEPDKQEETSAETQPTHEINFWKMVEHSIGTGATGQSASQVKQYVEQSAEFFKCTTSDIMKQVTANDEQFHNFWDGFVKWAATQLKPDKPPVDTDKELDKKESPKPAGENWWYSTGNWNHLQTRKFEKTVHEHLEDLENANERVEADVRAKWAKLKLGKFPIDLRETASPVTTQPPPEQQNGSDKISSGSDVIEIPEHDLGVIRKLISYEYHLDSETVERVAAENDLDKIVTTEEEGINLLTKILDARGAKWKIVEKY